MVTYVLYRVPRSGRQTETGFLGIIPHYYLILQFGKCVKLCYLKPARPCAAGLRRRSCL